MWFVVNLDANTNQKKEKKKLYYFIYFIRSLLILAYANVKVGYYNNLIIIVLALYRKLDAGLNPEGASRRTIRGTFNGFTMNINDFMLTLCPYDRVPEGFAG